MADRYSVKYVAHLICVVDDKAGVQELQVVLLSKTLSVQPPVVLPSFQYKPFQDRDNANNDYMKKKSKTVLVKDQQWARRL